MAKTVPKTDPETQRYRLAQFERVSTEYIEFPTKIKFIKPDGQTNWLDITNDEFDEIKTLLT